MRSSFIDPCGNPPVSGSLENTIALPLHNILHIPFWWWLPSWWLTASHTYYQSIFQYPSMAMKLFQNWWAQWLTRVCDCRLLLSIRYPMGGKPEARPSHACSLGVAGTLPGRCSPRWHAVQRPHAPCWSFLVPDTAVMWYDTWCNPKQSPVYIHHSGIYRLGRSTGAYTPTPTPSRQPDLINTVRLANTLEREQMKKSPKCQVSWLDSDSIIQRSCVCTPLDLPLVTAVLTYSMIQMNSVFQHQQTAGGTRTFRVTNPTACNKGCYYNPMSRNNGCDQSHVM